ncbi:MAG: ATP-binding protein [Candidatus Omnitrophota bacterium]
MQNKIIDKKGPKGLSIFQRLFISYFGVGIVIIVITGAQYYLYKQKAIKKELKSQFSNALGSSIAYFDRIYTSRIRGDCDFIEKSSVFNSFLSSQKDEILLTKPLAEQLFLHFTNRAGGIYLSARFIDPKGIERVITKGNKRLRNYVSLDNFPPTDILHSKIYTLFKRLKREKIDAILFEGPFEYGGKFTFFIGTPKYDPEVGGFAGAVIFHCDLTDYLKHLDGYVFYNEHVASLFTLDDELIFAPGQKSLLYRHPDSLKNDNPLSFYIVSDTVKIGSNNQALFKVVLGISPDIFHIESKNAFKDSILYIFLITVLIIILALVMSKQFSIPLVGLVTSANRLAKGDLSTRVNVNAGGEIGLLVDSFNNMVEDLQKTTTSIDNLNKEIAVRKKVEENLSETLKDEATSRKIVISMLDDNNQIREKLEQHIEDLKLTQDMLIQSEKLASLGKLVSSMAHEVNNPLMIISGNAQLSLMEEIQSEAVKNNLKIIMEECLRAKNIIRRLLKFSRPSKGETKEVDINKSIEAVLGIMEHQFKLDDVEIKRNYQENLPLITIDEQQIQEVFMNLINNAKDAMSGVGAITITTFLEGDFLRLDFKDTGSGMPEEAKKRLFEPFFTTKEKGTGLGLAVCYGIIKAHNGELKFESELKKGTTASILLPLGGGKA